MTYFKDKIGGLHFLSDEDIANGGIALVESFAGDVEEISEDEAALLLLPSFDDRKSAKARQVDEIVREKLHAGYGHAADQHVALDEGSRADMTAMATTAIAAAASTIPWPDSYQLGWITLENTRIALATPADGLTLAAAVGNYYATIRQRGRDLKDAIIASADETTLNEIDIDAGWPAA